jgi:hypothetical protein
MDTFLTVVVTLFVFTIGPFLALANHPETWIVTVLFIIAFVASWFVSSPWRWIFGASLLTLWVLYGFYCVGHYHLVEWP